MRYGLEGKIFRVARPIHWRNTCSRRIRAFLSRFKNAKKYVMMTGHGKRCFMQHVICGNAFRGCEDFFHTSKILLHPS